MSLRRPSRADLVDLGQRHHLHHTEAEVDDFMELVAGVIGGYDELERYPEPVRPVFPAVRQGGPRPEPGARCPW